MRNVQNKVLAEGSHSKIGRFSPFIIVLAVSVLRQVNNNKYPTKVAHLYSEHLNKKKKFKKIHVGFGSKENSSHFPQLSSLKVQKVRSASCQN